MALQNTKQNMAQRMMGGIGNMAGMAGRAIGQGVNNLTSPFRGKPKPIISKPQNKPMNYFADQQQRVNEIDRLSK